MNMNKESNRAACKKCGYTGHLTFQCRNFLKVSFFHIFVHISLNISVSGLIFLQDMVFSQVQTLN